MKTTHGGTYPVSAKSDRGAYQSKDTVPVPEPNYRRVMQMSVKKIIALCVIMMVLWGTPVYADQVHRVSPGETLNGIARFYGITTDSLLGSNQYIVNPDLIFPGQVLIVPDTGKHAYVVRPGDTLSQIAQSFGVPTAMLANINNISNPDFLYVGQILLVPNMYIVREGDTLPQIAQSLGVSISDLMTENNLRGPQSIYPGQTLSIPSRPTGREELAALDGEMGPIAARFPETFFYKGQPNGLRVALTFDDGPDRVETNAVLDILKQYQVPATFFLLGRSMPGNSDVVERIVAEGHTLASHTTNHFDIRELTEQELRTEMLTLENEVYDITGLRMALMRPPYGFINDANIRQLRDMGYKVVKWSVDTNDWRDIDVDQVLINTMPNIRDGSIILMHDYLPESMTKEVLPEIIQSLRSQGYTFVTVDELLGIDAYR